MLGDGPGHKCYEFILIFNDNDCQKMFIEVAACMWHLISNQCMQVAKSWEFGHLMTVAS